MDGWMEGRMDGWTDGSMYQWMYACTTSSYMSLPAYEGLYVSPFISTRTALSLSLSLCLSRPLSLSLHACAYGVCIYSIAYLLGYTYLQVHICLRLCVFALVCV